MTLFGYDISQFLAGMLLGAALLYFLIKALSGLYSPFNGFNNFRQDYGHYSRRGYRDERGGNGFVFFLLILIALIFAVKMLSNGGFSISGQKNFKDALPAVNNSPASAPQSKGIGEGDPLYPPPEYVHSEKGDVPQKESEEDISSAEQYFVQTDCLDELDSAQERAESLHQAHGLPTGVMKKEIDGSIKYAPFLGPFDSSREADDANQRCCKFKGWVQPYRDIDEINW